TEAQSTTPRGVGGAGSASPGQARAALPVGSLVRGGLLDATRVGQREVVPALLVASGLRDLPGLPSCLEALLDVLPPDAELLRDVGAGELGLIERASSLQDIVHGEVLRHGAHDRDRPAGPL